MMQDTERPRGCLNMGGGIVVKTGGGERVEEVNTIFYIFILFFNYLFIFYILILVTTPSFLPVPSTFSPSIPIFFSVRLRYIAL